MEKINIAELLKDCPKGMELDCMMYEDVYFDYVDELNIIHCYIQYETHKTSIPFNQHGTPNSNIKSKCVIFPKGKTTWEGFHRPFKDGDIIYVRDEYSDATFTYVAILKQLEKGGKINSHCFYNYEDDVFSINNFLFDGYSIRFATEEEKEKLFDTIKDKGFKWNEEIKTLEKMKDLKFKIGDKITNGIVAGKIRSRDIDSYQLDNDVFVFFSALEKWKLDTSKFDINTLVPFESRVLVRDYDNMIWIPTFWGKYLGNSSNCRYLTINGCYNYCIPYEGNEHLLGKKDDCDEFYKTWK